MLGSIKEDKASKDYSFRIEVTDRLCRNSLLVQRLGIRKAATTSAL